MLLKDLDKIELPQFRGGSYARLDRIYVSHEKLILIGVEQLESGDLRLITKAENGPEEFKGKLRFKLGNENKKKSLYNWLNEQLGKTIDSAYQSEHSFKEDG